MCSMWVLKKRNRDCFLRDISFCYRHPFCVQLKRAVVRWVMFVSLGYAWTVKDKGNLASSDMLLDVLVHFHQTAITNIYIVNMKLLRSKWILLPMAAINTLDMHIWFLSNCVRKKLIVVNTNVLLDNSSLGSIFYFIRSTASLTSKCEPISHSRPWLITIVSDGSHRKIHFSV
jgi:hypothetical protein